MPTATEYSTLLILIIIVGAAVVIVGSEYILPSLASTQESVEGVAPDLPDEPNDDAGADPTAARIGWLWAVCLAAFSGALAGAAWSVRGIVSRYQRHAQMLVLEVLSDGKPRSRQCLVRDVSKTKFVYRFAVSDALSELVLNGRVEIANSQYAVSTTGRKAESDSVATPVE